MSKNIRLKPKFENDLAVNFIKNTISNNNIEEESTLKRIIESIKIFQLNVQKDSLFKILNMRNNQSFSNVYHNLNIDDLTKQQNYPLLSTLNVSFTSHTVSTLLYEIVKLFQEFLEFL